MPDEIRAQIDDFLDDLTVPKVEEEVSEEVTDESADDSTEVEQEVEESVEEESTEEVPSDEAEEVVEEETEEVVEEESVVTEEVVEEVVEEEVDELAALRDHSNAMAEVLLSKGIPLPGTGEVPVVETPVPAPAPQVPQRQMTLEDLIILEEGADFDSIMEDPKAFQDYQRGLLQRYGSLLEQQFTNAIPTIVANQVRQINALNKAVDTFYQENEDLDAVRPTVGAIADRIVAAHPDYSLDQVMAEAANTTRKVLKMPAPGTKKPAKRVITPSFAKPKGSKPRSAQPKISKLEKDISDLID